MSYIEYSNIPHLLFNIKNPITTLHFEGLFIRLISPKEKVDKNSSMFGTLVPIHTGHLPIDFRQTMI